MHKVHETNAQQKPCTREKRIIQAEHKAKRSYQEQRRSTYKQYTDGGYQSSGGSTYSGQSAGGGSYSVPSASTYSDDETAILKQFYRKLAQIFHPDVAGRDTTVEMQMLNKLKEQWGV